MTLKPGDTIEVILVDPAMEGTCPLYAEVNTGILSRNHWARYRALPTYTHHWKSLMIDHSPHSSARYIDWSSTPHSVVTF